MLPAPAFGLASVRHMLLVRSKAHPQRYHLQPVLPRLPQYAAGLPLRSCSCPEPCVASSPVWVTQPEWVVDSAPAAWREHYDIKVFDTTTAKRGVAAPALEGLRQALTANADGRRVIFISGSGGWPGNGDFPSGVTLGEQQLLNHSRLHAWYARNVDAYHPKLFHHPIAIELGAHDGWGKVGAAARSVGGKSGDEATGTNSSEGRWRVMQHIADASGVFWPTRQQRPTLLFLERFGAYFNNQHLAQLSDADVLTRLGHKEERRHMKPFARFDLGRKCANVSQRQRTNPGWLSKDRMLEEYARAQFVASPWGGGLDCHRTYEALAMGAIPIVRSSGPLDASFAAQPVLIVDDWADVCGPQTTAILGCVARRLAAWRADLDPRRWLPWCVEAQDSYTAFFDGGLARDGELARRRRATWVVGEDGLCEEM